MILTVLSGKKFFWSSQQGITRILKGQKCGTSSQKEKYEGQWCKEAQELVSFYIFPTIFQTFISFQGKPVQPAIAQELVKRSDIVNNKMYVKPVSYEFR